MCIDPNNELPRNVIPLREWAPECFSKDEPVTLKPAPIFEHDGEPLTFGEVLRFWCVVRGFCIVGGLSLGYLIWF